ncbi:MAG: hypothetical protein AMJ91_04145 [candidate division Zixibacteria bacterium SM23_73_3]|nr:MAG: hypothetical protein AMJ91_04145 [candidate division Zixibacteria bacterium SM23_73_3]
MRHFTVMKIGLVLFLCLMLFPSCGGKDTTRTTPEEYKFTVNGVVVKDVNSGKDIAYFAILRDGNPFDGAVVKVGADTLDNQGNGNYYLEGFPLFSFGQNVSINVSSADDDFNLSTSVLMPGSFQITNINHPTITSAQADQVVVYFSPSSGASGYFKSIVRPSGSNGYTALIPATEIGQTGIAADAFYEGLTFITGTYQVFLVSYRSSFLYYPGIEFYLPGGLPADNVSGANGTIGAGVVAPSVSIEAE